MLDAFAIYTGMLAAFHLARKGLPGNGGSFVLYFYGAFCLVVLIVQAAILISLEWKTQP
jgi:hypothetical protein